MTAKLTEEMPRTYRHPESLIFFDFAIAWWPISLPFIWHAQVSRWRYGPTQLRIQTEVLSHLLLRLLVCSNRSLICLLHSARVTCTLRCAHSCGCSLNPSLPSSWESKWSDNCSCLFFFVLYHSDWVRWRGWKKTSSRYWTRWTVLESFCGFFWKEEWKET